jgi:proteasome activator-like protein
VESQDVSPEKIERPEKLLRIAAMTQQLLGEVRGVELDERGRRALGDAYNRSLEELRTVLSVDLARELDDLSINFDSSPSSSELRVAQAQLTGWLEGLFQGLRAAMVTSQLQGGPPEGTAPQEQSLGQYL